MTTSPPRRVQVATGRRGMVVSGHSEATKAAWRTLSSGGTAADAAIAGAAILAVTQPQACTLGGDAFVLVHDASIRKTEGLNASGRSPRLGTRAAFEQGIPERGPKTISVPGVVGGWAALHQRYGKSPWASLLQPAIAIAREGCAVSKGLARASQVYADLLRASEPAQALFRPQDRPLKEGERFVQSALAETLEAIARDGAAAFYDGPIAQGIGRACEAQGALLRAEDLSGFTPEWVEPIEVTYRGHRVRAMPPNSYGLYLLLQLLALEDERLRDTRSDAPERIAALVRAARAAFSVGNKEVADPDFRPEPFAPLLGELGRERLRAAAPVRPPNLGGTAVISVVDASGNAVCLVQSIFLVFGSGIVDPASGILFQNRMIGFTPEAGHPNEVAPQKRPAHTLCPSMTFDSNGHIRYALGTPGGPGQTITLSQVIQAGLDLGLTLEEAVSVPRWSMDLGSQAVVEDSMPQLSVEGLRKLGVTLDKAQPNSPFFGSAEGIERLQDGTFKGVADFRRDAYAYGE